VKNASMSGTNGQGLRLETIRIKLSGTDADKYDIYYQVHAQNFGLLVTLVAFYYIAKNQNKV